MGCAAARICRRGLGEARCRAGGVGGGEGAVRSAGVGGAVVLTVIGHLVGQRTCLWDFSSKNDAGTEFIWIVSSLDVL